MAPSRKAAWLVVSALLVATTLVWAPDGKEVSAKTRTIGRARIVSMESLPEEGIGDICEFPSTSLSLAAAGPQPASSGTAAASQEGAPPSDASRAEVARRKPLRIITDPNFSFAGVAVDPIRNEVVLADENISALVVYDRLTNTAPTARSEPKRVIEGDKTFLEYAASVYIDPDTGDIRGINNDTMNWSPVFGREAQGNVPPKSNLDTPHTAHGIAADEGARELFLTIQDDHAVVVFDKAAKDGDSPVRIIQGSRTEMADPHGIAVDTRRGEVFVSNWGMNNARPPLSEGGGGGRRFNDRWGAYSPPNYRKDFPVGRHRAFASSGKIQPPSITIYPKNARGDTAPVRVIQGSKTQLNWPTALAVHAERGELFVANDVGDGIAVFRTDATGDVAPIRVIKGPRSMIKNPTGVAVDLKNNELWVANFGNHSATAYRIDAAGDVAPLRAIRSAPADAQSPMLSNAHTVAFDTKREELLVAN